MLCNWRPCHTQEWPEGESNHVRPRGDADPNRYHATTRAQEAARRAQQVTRQVEVGQSDELSSRPGEYLSLKKT